CLDADHRINAGRSILWVAIAATSVIETRAAFSPRLLAHRSKLFLTAIATIPMARGKQLLRHLAVTRGARKLENDFPVPGKPEPGQSVDNGVYRRSCGALSICILDPQQHLAAVPAGVQPVEQGGAAAADVKKTGGRGRKAGDDGFAHCEPSTTI